MDEPRPIREIDGIQTVGDLRRALEHTSDEMKISDVFGEPVCLTWWEATADDYAFIECH